MSKKICCFAGHSKIYTDKNIEFKVYEKCEELITKADVTTFWVGNYGAFDRLAASTIRQLKEKYSHIELDLVLPYITEAINIWLIVQII